MRVFATGSPNGQLYWELARTKPESVDWLVWPHRLDIRDAQAVTIAIREMRPDVIVNAAAYTAVDKAESEPDLAFAINQTGVAHLAEAADAVSARLVHVSTDFVFTKSSGQPFKPDATVSPVSVYGKSKLAGEQVLLEAMPDASAIVRTAWLYSSHGNNFVKTMLRLMGEKDELGVVADQIGSPTWAHSLANALWQTVLLDVSGTLHWTGAGVASWYDFAMAIGEEAKHIGLIDKVPQINALTTRQYPTPAQRPSYSVLALGDSWERLDIVANHWRSDLRSMLRELGS